METNSIYSMYIHDVQLGFFHFNQYYHMFLSQETLAIVILEQMHHLTGVTKRWMSPVIDCFIVRKVPSSFCQNSHIFLNHSLILLEIKFCLTPYNII